MEQVEITHEDVRGIDINQVASMQLKDGTVVVVNNEGEEEGAAGAENENYQEDQYADFAQEELPQEDAGEYAEGYEEEQDNQLRRRPMMMVGRPMVPAVPMVPVARPPLVPPRTMVPRRGPVIRPMAPMGGYGYGLPLRGRPGMPVAAPRPVPGKIVKPVPVPMRPAVVPVRPVVPVKPAVVPVRPVVPVKPAVVPVRPGVPVKPAVVPVRPTVQPKPVAVPMTVPLQKPLVNQMIKAPGVFRARPATQEEEADFQEEYAGEDQYCHCEEQAQEEYPEEQLRGRPLVNRPVVPIMAPRVVPTPVVPVPHRPVYHPKPVVPVVPVVPKRGPVVPGVGYNTYQPRVFRGKHGLRTVPIRNPATMLPLTAYPPRPPVHRYRNRPRSASEGKEYAEEYQNECNQTCVCSKCGKEF